MKKLLWIVAVTSAFSASAAFAGGKVPTAYSLIGSGSKTETRAYAGLNWNLESGKIPAVVLGVFRARVKADGDTQGGNLGLHLNIANGIKPGKLKLGYLQGKEDVQGEVAVGYSFLKSAPLLGLGVNGPHVSAGVDVYTNPGFDPYLMLHSQGEFDEPNLACVADPSGIYLDPDCSIID